MGQKTSKTNIIAAISGLKNGYTAEGFIIKGIFGSYARQDYDELSDIDIAYEIESDIFFKKYRGFLAVSRIAEIGEELSAALGKKVDLFSLNSSNKALVKKISAEMINE